MKRIWLRGLAVLLVAASLVGCSINRPQGTHYGGWGGCCSHGPEHAEAIHGGAAGVPMMPAQPGGYPLYTPHAPPAEAPSAP